MRKYIIAVAGVGLLLGVVPAQAEEVDLRPPGACADFYTEFGPNDNNNLSDVKVDGAAWSGTLVTVPEQLEQFYDVYLPYLKVAPIYPENSAFKCQHQYRIPVDNEWIEKSDGWSSRIEPVGSAHIGDDGRPYMYFNETFPAYIEVLPQLDVDSYGVYTNINNISVTSPLGESQYYSGYKETEVSYTLTVVPPTETDNQLPEVPNEPAGISDGYDFGNVEIFDYKRGDVKITNIGTEDLRVNKAKIVDGDGNDAPEFSVTDNDCNRLIAPGRSCRAQVQFFPREQGARAAFINVTSNSSYPLQIPLNGVGTYTKPESIEDAESEAEETGQPPVFEVDAPEQAVPDNQNQEVTKKNGKWEVKTKKKKIKVKWKSPDTDQPVTGYEIRKKFKKKKWKKWKDVDPMPNKKGWIKASVKAKKPGNYKIQVTSSTPWVSRGDKATVKITKK